MNPPSQIVLQDIFIFTKRKHGNFHFENKPHLLLAAADGGGGSEREKERVRKDMLS